MAIGKAGVPINLEKLSLKFGSLYVLQNGKLNINYDESVTSNYMKEENITIEIDISNGSKNFKVYTMDFTKKYIEINADYRS